MNTNSERSKKGGQSLHYIAREWEKKGRKVEKLKVIAMPILW